jgi:glycosyltransferase involved in cell wall biosynthesis
VGENAVHPTEGVAISRPQRILYVDHVAQLSGGEIALVRLIRALGEQIEAHVVLGEDGPLVDDLKSVGAVVHVVPLPTLVTNVRKDTVRPTGLKLGVIVQTAGYTWRLRRFIREVHPDIVHTNSLKSAIYGGIAGRMAGVPVIWHIRDRIAPDYLPIAAVWAVRFLARVVPNWLVANSAATLSTVRRTRHATVVHSGVIYDSLAGTSSRAMRGRSRNTAPFTVGVVGRLASWKGQHIFLEAFVLAFGGGQERAVIVGSAMFGEDAYAASLVQLAQDLGIDDRVDFRGYQSDVPEELNQMDVLVHCSITPEPFGQVVVEGMAAGLPVIAAAAGGPREIITDGVDGLLVEPGAVRDLAEAMRRLADSPRLRFRLGDAAQASSERFGPDTAADAMLSVYEDVLSKS